MTPTEMVYGDAFMSSWNLPILSEERRINDAVVAEVNANLDENLKLYITDLKARLQVIHDSARKIQAEIVAKRLDKANNDIITFDVGDFVLLKHRYNDTITKQEAKLLGPFKILEKLANGVYKLQHLIEVARIETVSEERLVPFCKDGATEAELKKMIEYDEDELPVDSIVRHGGSMTRNGLKFLVHWRGFDNEEDFTWEPYKNLEGNVSLSRYISEHENVMPTWILEAEREIQHEEEDVTDP
jgi:hypothetical protein